MTQFREILIIFTSKIFHRDTDRRVVFKFREIWPTENSEIVRCLSDKNISPDCRYWAYRLSFESE